MIIRYELPIRTQSEANMREHWAKKAKRVKAHRLEAAYITRDAIRGRLIQSAVITLIRIAPKCLDSDNLAGSCKGVRDGIADALEIDDGDKRLKWLYDQTKRRPKEYAVQVLIEVL